MAFGIVAAAYDAMIDWDKRLAHEAPFFRELFAQVNAKSVLDAACGTGRHAGMFASWGLSVQGADVSETMVQYCQDAYRAIANMSFVVRPFTQAAPEQYDAVVCMGNSLSLASREEVPVAIAAMSRSVRPGGVLALHVMNLYAREEGPIRWDKTVRRRLEGHDTLIVKGTRRCTDHGFVDVVIANLDQDPPVLTTDSNRLLAISGEEMTQACVAAGLSCVQLYGDYRHSEYQPQSSRDLIVVARA